MLRGPLPTLLWRALYSRDHNRSLLGLRHARVGLNAQARPAAGLQSDAPPAAQGYRNFGINRANGVTTYREWAPAAQAAWLIGDFNEWKGTPLAKDDFGVWSVELPDGPGGAPAIAHKSRVKVRLQHWEGWTIDLVPAWAQATHMPEGHGSTFDGVHWDPPAHEKHQWCAGRTASSAALRHPLRSCPGGNAGPLPPCRRNRKPARHPSLRIYEAHVGMASEKAEVATYDDFRRDVLPRVARQGFNCVQLMAVQEHPYYASFGYHVTNPFAPASRSGDPESLKALIDEAHGLGIAVLIDVVHSHICKNVHDGLAGFDFGQDDGSNYFHAGERGYHSVRRDGGQHMWEWDSCLAPDCTLRFPLCATCLDAIANYVPMCAPCLARRAPADASPAARVQQWDSRLLVYSNWEVQRYLLSNVRYWLEEFQFDGFRFDGVTSMLYHHHGINMGFSGNYAEYFGTATNVDACVYLMLANDLMHELNRDALSIAEDVSGMPALGRPVAEGGLGFDFRLGMAIPDLWIDLLKNFRDEHWRMSQLVGTLCNRRYTERTVAYAESHDQSIVGAAPSRAWGWRGRDRGAERQSMVTSQAAAASRKHPVRRAIARPGVVEVGSARAQVTRPLRCGCWTPRSTTACPHSSRRRPWWSAAWPCTR